MTVRRDNEQTRAFLASVEFDLDPELRIENPAPALALAEWNGLRGDRAMPAPADIDALDLPRQLLPHLLLLDIEHEPVLRYRWRLIGTHTTAALGRDMTGRYWDDIYDDRGLAMLARGPQWVLRHRRPVRVLGAATYADKDHVRSESVDLPLSNDGTTAHRILIATVYRTG
ncbi:PAS domain-containing protein [Thalassobaculum sp.]|uniref:PAS domain-containing protein n=1 Tax=Thalassobaculum sp. TaxID=2022740 RepID=UPI0032ED3251